MENGSGASAGEDRSVRPASMVPRKHVWALWLLGAFLIVHGITSISSPLIFHLLWPDVFGLVDWLTLARWVWGLLMIHSCVRLIRRQPGARSYVLKLLAIDILWCGYDLAHDWRTETTDTAVLAAAWAVGGALLYLLYRYLAGASISRLFDEAARKDGEDETAVPAQEEAPPGEPDN